MLLSIATDYLGSTDDPLPHLRLIAAAGFTHIHWCHQWASSYLYANDEISRIGECLKECGLILLDLHATNGAGEIKDGWWVDQGTTRYQTGMALLENRIEMTARLGGGVVIVHLPRVQDFPSPQPNFFTRLRQTLDLAISFAQKHRVRLAVENVPVPGFFAQMREILGWYGPDRLGICYDSGHGNIGIEQGLDNLGPMADRLIATHLHDNDGKTDQHCVPFTGTVDWPRLAEIISRANYAPCLNLELRMDRGLYAYEDAFLSIAYKAGLRLTCMVTAPE
jgi:sugar phosphate isomerase/epimerase